MLADSAPYHRAMVVRAAAASLDVHLLPLQGYSPALMADEPLWRWLCGNFTDHPYHTTAEDLVRLVAALTDSVSAKPMPTRGDGSPPARCDLVPVEMFTIAGAYRIAPHLESA
jgi:hypothetical protein